MQYSTVAEGAVQGEECYMFPSFKGSGEKKGYITEAQ